MDVSGALSVALSGLKAGDRRLEVSASNVANVRTDGARPGASAAAQAAGQVYQPAQVVQRDLGQGGGTSTTVAGVQPATYVSYDPTAPYADSSGLVAAPNVDLAGEGGEQLSTLMFYSANAQVVKVASQMAKRTVDMLA